MRFPFSLRRGFWPHLEADVAAERALRTGLLRVRNVSDVSVFVNAKRRRAARSRALLTRIDGIKKPIMPWAREHQAANQNAARKSLTHEVKKKKTEKNKSDTNKSSKIFYFSKNVDNLTITMIASLLNYYTNKL